MCHIDLEIIFYLEKNLKCKLKSNFESYIIYKHNS